MVFHSLDIRFLSDVPRRQAECDPGTGTAGASLFKLQDEAIENNLSELRIGKQFVSVSWREFAVSKDDARGIEKRFAFNDQHMVRGPLVRDQVEFPPW